MKHRAFLRRSLPLLSLTVLLLTFALPTYALFGIGEEAEAPSVAAFSKNGPAGSAITFSPAHLLPPRPAPPPSIVLSTPPDHAAAPPTLPPPPPHRPVLPAPDRLRRHLRQLYLYPRVLRRHLRQPGGGGAPPAQRGQQRPHRGES